MPAAVDGVVANLLLRDPCSFGKRRALDGPATAVPARVVPLLSGLGWDDPLVLQVLLIAPAVSAKSALVVVDREGSGGAQEDKRKSGLHRRYRWVIGEAVVDARLAKQ